MSASCEAWFYHLERSSVVEVLPELLEKTLARGWRALVISGAPEGLEGLDDRLWTHGREHVLCHGREGEPHEARQPILLSASGENRNAAQVVFLLEDAHAHDLDGYVRCVDLFDGRDEQAVAGARARWKSARAQGAVASYWRQTEGGRWSKQA